MMNQHRFGVNAAYLGAKIALAPDERPGPAGWRNALLLDAFYRANGNPGQVTPTKAQVAWDDAFLYVLFLNWESAENVDQVRRDIDDLVVSSGTLGHRDFAVFSVGRDGKTKSFLESGMTYIGGDEAFGGSQPNLPFEHIGNKGDIRTIDPQAYTVVVDRQDGFWSAAYKIPWPLVGGFPKDNRFAFQVYRKKQATGEILCPTPLDLYINLPYWFEYDPSTFIRRGSCSVSTGRCAWMPILRLPVWWRSADYISGYAAVFVRRAFRLGLGPAVLGRRCLRVRRLFRR